MNLQATIKYTRISPKKIRELGHAIKGLTVLSVLDKLSMAPDKASRLLAKAVNSAKANAVNNQKIPVESLRIKCIEIGKGPFFKRWNPVSKGMAHAIKKRTAHIKVFLEEVKTDKKKDMNEVKQLPAKQVQKIETKDGKVDVEKKKQKEKGVGK